MAASTLVDPAVPAAAEEHSLSGLGYVVKGLRPGVRRWGWLGVVAATTATVRLPLLGLPLDPDEGGYAYVARQWAAGSSLYTQGAWVDRPPGLMLAFRWITDISYTAAGLRLAAMLSAVVLAIGAGCCARVLAGPGAGLAAGMLAGVVLAGPFIEGYQLNGELLASTVGTWGVMVAVSWRAGRLGARWLLLAGALAGLAPLVKQSGVDGLVAVLTVAVAGTVGARRFRPLVMAILGALMPLGAAAAWAAATGWSGAWYAVVGFQARVAQTQSLRERVSAAAGSLRHVTPDLLGLALAAVAAAAVLAGRRERLWPVPIWVSAALLAAASSPFGHPHYWVQTVAPLSVLAASIAPRLDRMSPRCRRAAVGALSAALAFPLLAQGVTLAHGQSSRPAFLTGDRRPAADADVASWLRSHDLPGGKVYAFVGAAELYMLAGRDTGYPYLWDQPVRQVPGALALLRKSLAAPTGPQFVILYQNPDSVDASGWLTQILELNYAHAATIDGYLVLERRGPPIGRNTSRATYK